MSAMQYIIFKIGSEEYGVEISFAQEVIRIPKQMTKIPNMPSFIEGVVHLRSKVIPVFDLKKRFGLEQTEQSVDSRLLILNLQNSLYGMIVDDISEVMYIDEECVEKLSTEISSIGNNCLKGIGQIEKRLILLLEERKIITEVFKKNDGERV